LLQVIGSCATLAELFDALPGPDGILYKAVQRMVAQGIIALDKPRTAVQVVTDSTADLPQDLVRSHGILVVPLSILFGKHTFRDGVDIQPRDFYELLETSDDHPSTAPPTEGEFYEHFYDLVVEQDILGIHISAKLSQTLAHARQAALRGSRGFDHLPPERHNFALELIDSKNVSMATGLLALFAARMARRGHPLGPISHMIQGLIPRIQILFVVNTLDYLLKGGRIGKARALVGKLFGIKPILSVVDGEVTSIDRVRGGRQAQQRIVEILAERLDRGKPAVAAVAHARAPVWGDRLRSLIEKRFELREGIVTDIGPVVGTHAGPGCVGCVVVQPTAEEWELIRPLE
jgi:DegV family protein with EDD domain